TLLFVKVVLAVLLGGSGMLLRNRALRSAAGPAASWRGLAGVGLVELGLLVTLYGVSVGLTHLALPDFLTQQLSTPQMLLGYTLQDPPTVLRLLTNWRVELLFTP